MDFLDPANLLGKGLEVGRSPFVEERRIRPVGHRCTGLVGDPELRDQMFRDAERILAWSMMWAVSLSPIEWAGDLFSLGSKAETIREPDSIGASQETGATIRTWSILCFHREE
ncbi:MAG: hypothetical protein R2838_13995 [Caldilineaceae bacterium]